ncbi:hypothetical protein B0J14DRAFT_657555 [Halenospora varia]|nr:hypothetical protein B0J14DRAFT_657555 [Halenospora varia]
MKLTRNVEGVDGRRARVRPVRREALRELRRQDESSSTTAADGPSATNSGSGGGGDNEGDDESDPSKPKPGPGGGKPGPSGPPGPAKGQSTTTIQAQTTPPPVASPTTIFTTVTTSSTPPPPPSTSQAAQTSFVTNSITSQVTLAPSSTPAQSTTTPRAISTTTPIVQSAISTSSSVQASTFNIITLPSANPTTLPTSSLPSTTLPPTTTDPSQTFQSATAVADPTPTSTDPSADHKGIASSLTPGGNALLGIGIAGAISGILLALFIFARRRKALNRAGKFTMAQAPARVREAYERGGNAGPGAGPGAGGARQIRRNADGRFEHEVRIDIPQNMNGQNQQMAQMGPRYIMAPAAMGGPPSMEAPAVPEKNCNDDGPSGLNQNQYGGKRTLHNPITRKVLPIVSITSSRHTDDVDSDGEDLMKPEKVPEVAPPVRDGRVKSVFGGTPRLRESVSWVREQTRRRSEF